MSSHTRTQADQLPRTPSSAETLERLKEIDALLEETHTSSFGIPPTQGEIQHYEDNKEKILALCHEAIPSIASLCLEQAEEIKRLRTEREDLLKTIRKRNDQCFAFAEDQVVLKSEIKRLQSIIHEAPEKIRAGMSGHKGEAHRVALQVLSPQSK